MTHDLFHIIKDSLNSFRRARFLTFTLYVADSMVMGVIAEFLDFVVVNHDNNSYILFILQGLAALAGRQYSSTVNEATFESSVSMRQFNRLYTHI